MSRKFFNMLLAQQQMQSNNRIVFTARDIFESHKYGLEGNLWQASLITDSKSGREYIHFKPKQSSLSTDRYDRIYIHTSKDNLKFKYKDYQYVRVGYRTNIYHPHASNYLNFCVIQSEYWDFSWYTDNKLWVNPKNVNRYGAESSFIVRGYSDMICNDPDTAYAISVRFLPYWYPLRDSYTGAEYSDYTFPTESGDYFDFEYVAFFKTYEEALNF